MADEAIGKAEELLTKNLDSAIYGLMNLSRSKENMDATEVFALRVAPQFHFALLKWKLVVNGTLLIEDFSLTNASVMMKRVDELFTLDEDTINNLVQLAKDAA